MSLILEALQRADQERRNSDDVPGIDADHISREPEHGANNRHTVSSRIYVPLLLGLVLALSIYVAFLQWPTSSSPTQVNTTTSTATDGRVAAVKSSANNVSDQSNLAASPTLSDPALSNNATNAAATSSTNTGDTNDEFDRLSPSEIAALYEQAQQPSELIDYAQDEQPEEVDVAETANRERTDTVDEITTARPATTEADAIYLRLPFASQLPEYQQRSIPAIRYTTHGYDPNTGNGRVTLNGRSYRRGDSMAGGLLLIDIRADYIVIDMEGTLFRLHAASDWTP